MRRVTTESTQVAADIRKLNRSMQADDVGGARACAVKLKRDAQALQHAANRTERAVRELAAVARKKVVGSYFSLTASTLSWQGKEGQVLMQLADSVWADPLVMTSADETRVDALSRQAQWTASRAVQSAGKAAAWRRHYARLLRYVVVNEAPTKG